MGAYFGNADAIVEKYELLLDYLYETKRPSRVVVIVKKLSLSTLNVMRNFIAYGII